MRILSLLLLIPSLALADVSVNGVVSIKQNDAGYGPIDVRPVGSTSDPFNQSSEGRLRPAPETLMLSDPVETALDVRKWLGTLNVWATPSVVANAISFNSGASTAVGGTQIISINYFTPFGDGYVSAQGRVKFTGCSQANVTCEWGFGLVGAIASAALPTDGAHIRISNAGAFCVYNVGGSEVTTALSAVPTSAIYYDVELRQNVNRVECSLHDAANAQTITANVSVANTSVASSASQRLPFFVRLYKTGVGGTAPNIEMTSLEVSQEILEATTPLIVARSADGESIERTPTAVSNFSAPSSNACNTTGTATNSVPRVRTSAPGGTCGNIAACTLSNTASCYANTFAGGWFQIATVACPAAVASCGEWIAFGYLVPTGRQLVVTGWDIDCFNTGAAVATTSSVFHFMMGSNSNAVNLTNEVESATIYEYEKTSLGTMTAAIGVVLGGVVGGIHLDFGNRPRVVQSGRYLTLIGRILLSTATASEAYQCYAMPTGYFIN